MPFGPGGRSWHTEGDRRALPPLLRERGAGFDAPARGFRLRTEPASQGWGGRPAFSSREKSPPGRRGWGDAGHELGSRLVPRTDLSLPTNSLQCLPGLCNRGRWSGLLQARGLGTGVHEDEGRASTRTAYLPCARAAKAEALELGVCLGQVLPIGRLSAVGLVDRRSQKAYRWTRLCVDRLTCFAFE